MRSSSLEITVSKRTSSLWDARQFTCDLERVYQQTGDVYLAFHGKPKNLTLDGGFQTRRSRLKLIALIPCLDLNLEECNNKLGFPRKAKNNGR